MKDFIINRTRLKGKALSSIFRLRLARFVYTVSVCIFVCTSCNSSRHIAGIDFQNNMNQSRSIGKQYNTHKKRKYGSVKCNHVKVNYVNVDNNEGVNSEIFRDRSDFTLIFLKEHKYYPPYTSDNISKESEILPIVK